MQVKVLSARRMRIMIFAYDCVGVLKTHALPHTP